MFKYQNGYIVNIKNNKVFEVAGGTDNEGSKIILYAKNGKRSQQWNIVFADKMKPEPKKGELNKEFGLYVERAFHVVSALGSHRYMDLINNQMVIKTPNGFKTQVWYFDQDSKTIRSTSNGRSWDIKNAGASRDMQVWATHSQWFQLFKYENDYFVNVQNNKVVEVAKDEEGGKAVVWNKRGGNAVNQRWKVVYIDSKPKDPDVVGDKNEDFGFRMSKPFYIVSAMPWRRIITSVDGKNVAIKSYQKGAKQQLWWFDQATKTIKSYNWKDRAFEITNNGESNNLGLATANARWFQLFRYQKGGFLVNEKGKAIEVSGERDDEGANVAMGTKTGNVNQRWNIVYADDDRDPTGGATGGDDFGFKGDQKFHIVSGMKSGRYVDLVGEDAVIKTPNGFKTQQWYFHWDSRTIKSVATGKSISIKKDGGSKDVHVWQTNSKWFQLWKYTEGTIQNVYKSGLRIEVEGG